MNNKGYSVTEVVVAMLISTLVIMAAYSMHTFYVSSVSKFLKNSDKEKKQLAFLQFAYEDLKEAEDILTTDYSGITYLKGGDTIKLGTADTSILFQRNSSEEKVLFEGISGAFTIVTEDTVSGFSFLLCTAKISDTTDHNLQRVITVKKNVADLSESDWGF